MGVGGAVGLSTAANIFVGMVEAPLFIRPYLVKLTRGELFIVMTGGMAGIAGTVLVIYSQFLSPIIPDAAGHFIVASVLGAPAAILFSQIMVPDARRKTRAVKKAAGCNKHHRRDRQRHHWRARTPAQHHRHAHCVFSLVHLANAILGLLPALGGPLHSSAYWASPWHRSAG